MPIRTMRRNGRRGGIVKRLAEYVPAEYRTVLNQMSKADLMEVAYSLAVRCTGCEDFDEAFVIVKDEHVALCGNLGRTPVKFKAPRAAAI